MKWAFELQNGDLVTLGDGQLPPAELKQMAKTLLVVPEPSDPCRYVFKIQRTEGDVLLLKRLHRLLVFDDHERHVISTICGLQVDGHEFTVTIHPYGLIEIHHEKRGS